MIFAGTQGYLDDIPVEQRDGRSSTACATTCAHSTPRCSTPSASRRCSTRPTRRLLRGDIERLPQDGDAGRRAGQRRRALERRRPTRPPDRPARKPRPYVATLQDIRRRIASVAEHAQDHQGHGDGRGGQAAARPGAHRGAASLRRRHGRDDARPGHVRRRAGVVTPCCASTTPAQAERAASSSPATAAWPAPSTPTSCAPASSDRELRRARASDRSCWSWARRASAPCASAGYRLEQSGRARATARPTPTPRPSPTHVIELYTSEQVDHVRLIYNHFKSPIEQTLMNVSSCPSSQEVYTEGRRAAAGDVPLRARRGRRSSSAAAALRRDRRLPRAARIERQRAGRAHDAPCATPARAPTR